MQSSSHRGATTGFKPLTWRAPSLPMLSWAHTVMGGVCCPGRNWLWRNTSGTESGAFPFPLMSFQWAASSGAWYPSLSRPIFPLETPVWSLVWVPLPETGGPPFSSRWTWHWWDAPPCRLAAAAGPVHPALVPRWAEGQNKGGWFKTQLQRHNFLESSTQHLSLYLSILPLGL